jgi:hypothetical protein
MTIDFIMVEMVSRGTLYNACDNAPVYYPACGAGMAEVAYRHY